MSTDYLDAFTRHSQDAELLFQEERWPNADQLFGLAAECGLKTIMTMLGMRLRSDGAPDKIHHRVHINELWPEFHTFAGGYDAAQYVGWLPEENRFADWSAAQRYANGDSISCDVVTAHRLSAGRVHRIVSLALLDGRLA